MSAAETSLIRGESYTVCKDAVRGCHLYEDVVAITGSPLGSVAWPVASCWLH